MLDNFAFMLVNLTRLPLEIAKAVAKDNSSVP